MLGYLTRVPRQLQRLLASTGDVDAIDDQGRTMLLLAVIGGHVEIVQKARAHLAELLVGVSLGTVSARARAL